MGTVTSLLPLRRTKDFRNVHRQGRRARRDGVTVFVLRRYDEGAARLGLAVPSAVGGAVVRNRYKRRLRAAFRALGPPPAVDVVVRVDRTAPDDFQELVVQVSGALDDAGGRRP